MWPRLDFNVTKGLNHLIKAPFVAHPKTLRVAVPLRRDELMTFDPGNSGGELLNSPPICPPLRERERLPTALDNTLKHVSKVVVPPRPRIYIGQRPRF